MAWQKILVVLGVWTLAATASAQTTRPASGALEVRAAEAFAAGDYATAVPMLERLAADPSLDAAKKERIGEMIRMAGKNLPPAAAVLAAGKPAPNALQKPATTRPVARTPHVLPADGQPLAFKSIKDLGNFPYDLVEGGKLPEDVMALSGTVIRVPGYMLPLDQADRFTRFALVPDLMACCFGQPPSVEHTLLVTCPPGKALGYYPDPVVVTGTLKVEEKKDGDFVVSLFEMEAQSVKPAPR